MATFYIDHINGNDANDGTSWANAWKTITNGATAARIAPGDEIRIAKSPDPVNTGINATWTDGANQLTLSSAVTQTIYTCESNMTASANITCALNTSVTTRKHGSNSVSVTPASGFTTGKAAYYTLPAQLDLSGYQILNFWLRTNAVVSANTLSIKLCSDTTGDVAVDTFTLAEATIANNLMPIVIDKGATMGSTINSIAIYFNTDPGTTVFHFDMFFASKAASSADCLTLNHLVSKNSAAQGGSEPFLAIAWVDGTTLQLENYVTNGATYTPSYSGTTETVTLYTRKGITFPFSISVIEQTQEAGTLSSPFTYSGGWNTANTTQDGETFFDARAGAGAMLNSALAFNIIDHVSVVRASTGFGFSYKLTNVQTAANCSNIGITISQSGYMDNILNVVFCATGIRPSFSAGYIGNICSCQYGIDMNSTSGTPCGFIERIDNLSRCSTYGVYFSTNAVLTILRLDNLKNNVRPFYCSDDTAAILRVGNNNDTINATGNTNFFELGGSKGFMCRATFFNLSSEPSTPASGLTIQPETYVAMQKIGGDATANKIYYGVNTSDVYLKSQTSVRHTASDIAWEVQVPRSATNYTVERPFRLKCLGSYAVSANSAVTFKAWLRRDSANVTAKIVVPRGQLAGITTEQSATLTANADTWQELTLTFTPTEAGVITPELHVSTTAAATEHVYFDDVDCTQA